VPCTILLNYIFYFISFIYFFFFFIFYLFFLSIVKHNNILPNQHFRKQWAERVRTWLDQPKRKERRRRARAVKAAAVAPRPVDKLRPVVRCQTVRYNMRVRAGRGFTLEELKAAGVNAKLAPTIGISVDTRRTNKSKETLDENVARLKAYVSKLVLAPLHTGKSVKATGMEVSRKEFATLVADKSAISSVPAAAIRQPAAKVTFMAVTEDMQSDKYSAYKAIRQERTNARLRGKREKRAAEGTTDAPAEAPAAAE
jgi:large subunit ribosomal protein L13e